MASRTLRPKRTRPANEQPQQGRKKSARLNPANDAVKLASVDVEDVEDENQPSSPLTQVTDPASDDEHVVDGDAGMGDTDMLDGRIASASLEADAAHDRETGEDTMYDEAAVNEEEGSGDEIDNDETMSGNDGSDGEDNLNAHSMVYSIGNDDVASVAASEEEYEDKDDEYESVRAFPPAAKSSPSTKGNRATDTDDEACPFHVASGHESDNEFVMVAEDDIIKKKRTKSPEEIETEKAIKLLVSLGVKPGALAGTDIEDIMSMYRAVDGSRPKTVQPASIADGVPDKMKTASQGRVSSKPYVMKNVPATPAKKLPSPSSKTKANAKSSHATPTTKADSSAENNPHPQTPPRKQVAVASRAPSTTKSGNPSGTASLKTALKPRSVATTARSASNLKEALELLASVSVKPDRVQDWTVAEMCRLFRLITYLSGDLAIYTVQRVPTDAEWGKASPYVKTANVLCLKDSNTQIKVWIAGELASMWWFERDGGGPAKRVSVSIQPMVSTAASHCVAQIKNYCVPKGASGLVKTFGPDEVKFSSWMTRRSNKGEDLPVEEFSEIYDARVSLRDKSLLPKLTTGDLSQHDYVTVEATIRKYYCKAADGKPEHWEAYYDLQAIFLTKDANEVSVVAEPVLDVDI